MGYSFDYLDIPETVNPVTVKIHPHHWMNRKCITNTKKDIHRTSLDNTTRYALHAPHNKIWRVTESGYPWGNIPGSSDTQPP